MSPAPTVQLIQRHAGERTQALGLALARRSPVVETAHAVSAGGFPATLAASLELAQAAEHKWTVMIDGDVLLFPGAIDRGLDLAERYPDDHFVVTACIFDKLFGRARYGGVRFYRTRMIPEALRLGGWRDAQRPETALIESMRAHGRPSASTALLAGVHDYEQFYRDLYRTAVVNAVKFRKQLDWNMSRWRLAAASDLDFAVVLEGAADGRTLSIASLDRRDHLARGEEALRRLGLQEKEPLSSDATLDLERFTGSAAARLTTSSPLRRLLPELTLRMSPRPGQPRRLRTARLLLQNRRFLAEWAPIPLRRIL